MIVGDIRILRPGQTAELDLCTVGARVVWDTSGIDAAVLQIAMPGKAWPTSAQVTAKGSNDGLNFVAIDGGVAALTGAGATAPFDTTGFRYVAAETTTLGSGTPPIPFDVTLFGRAGVKA